MEVEKKVAESKNQNRQKNRKEKRNRSKKMKTIAKEAEPKPKNTLLPEQNKKPYHSNLPQLPVKRVVEPQEVCKLCNEVIDVIASALTHPDGGYCHFDCVLKKIAEDEHVTQAQKVSYIGRGTFAVIEQHEDGTFTIIKRIVWESGEAFDAMKKYVEAKKQ